jgi:hypothetical protein
MVYFMEIPKQKWDDLGGNEFPECVYNEPPRITW